MKKSSTEILSKVDHEVVEVSNSSSDTQDNLKGKIKRKTQRKVMSSDATSEPENIPGVKKKKTRPPYKSQRTSSNILSTSSSDSGDSPAKPENNREFKQSNQQTFSKIPITSSDSSDDDSSVVPPIKRGVKIGVKKTVLTTKIVEVSLRPADFNMFELFTNGYKQSIVDICRSTIGREYNQKQKLWSFPIQQYERLVQKIKDLGEIKIIRELDEVEKEKFQVVIVDDIEGKVILRFPYNNEINALLVNFDGVYSPEYYGWEIPIDHKDDLLKRLSHLDIEIKHLCEKPIGK